MIPIRVSPDLSAALLATVAIRASVVLAAAWLLTVLLRRSAASTRHAVWSVALASLLVVPLLWTVLPRWEPAGQPAPAPVFTPGRPAAVMSVQPAASSGAVSDHRHGGVAAFGPSSRRAGGLVPALVLGIWALGAAFGLGRLSAGWAAALRLVRRARPFSEPRIAAAAGEVCRQLGIRRAVRVLGSDTLSVPVNCGLLSPSVLLPAQAATWSEERLRVVLLHELAHVKRWDYAALIAAEAARALYWMNPLVWIAARRADVELERACDDEVLRAGTRSVEYAEHLYQIAASLSDARALRGALAMAQPSTLRTRVGAILAGRMNRAPVRARSLAWAGAIALLVGLPLASLKLLGEGRDAAVERAALAALNSPDATARAEAAWALGSRKSATATQPLIEHLSDPDPNVRGMTAWALGTIADGAARRPLEAALADGDAHVRSIAVLALGALGDRRSVAALGRLTSDPEMSVRSVLAPALQEIGGREAGEILGRILLHDGDEHTRTMAGWSLRLTLGEDALPVLVRALEDPSADVRMTAIRNLAELHDARAFDALARLARNAAEPQLRAASSWALGELHEPRAAAVLAAMLGDSVWPVRVAAARALGQTPGPAAIAPLIAATRDPVHQVSLTAIEALSERQ